jgi:hypothetical protein
MEERAARKGWTSESCFNHGRYLIDGKPYCARHAGMKAIKILMEK